MKIHGSKTAQAGVVLAASALVTAGVGATATAAGAQTTASHRRLEGRLLPLNNSGAIGRALVKVHHHRLVVEVRARGLANGLPHAMHIHFGPQARHQCPTVADDANGDFRLTTTEGAPAYGPVQVSLTTRGDTSPASVLAIARYPIARNGVIRYDRHLSTTKPVARAIRRGEAVLVVHGVDYNQNGKYDAGRAGQSDLDPKLPAEATDPALCGVLR